MVRKANLCPNCLKHEKNGMCRREPGCHCKAYHHKLLHNSEFKKKQVKTHKLTNISKNISVLPTAKIRAIAENGQIILLNALIDQGSTCSILTEKAARRLGRKLIPSDMEIVGVGDTPVESAQFITNVQLKPNFVSNFKLDFYGIVMKKITGMLPEMKIDINGALKELNKLQLADTDFMNPKAIDILIGASEYVEIIQDGIEKFSNLLAQRTKLRYIISGKSNDLRYHKTFMITTPDDKTMERFWDMEVEVEDDQFCENLYLQTTTKENGKYIVSYPFKENCKLGASKALALKAITVRKEITEKPKI